MIGVVTLVVVALLIGYGVWRAAPAVALRQVGAVQLSERDNPRLFNVTEGLCATFGLRMPDLYVVYDAVPNACALGRNAASSALVVTSGLLETMGPIELEGVIAHELAHVKRDDNGVSVIALTLARIGGTGLLRRCVGENREYRADIVGASAVRFPRGLLDALRLMEQAPAPAGNSVFSPARFAATRYVWIDPSVGCHEELAALGDLYVDDAFSVGDELDSGDASILIRVIEHDFPADGGSAENQAVYAAHVAAAFFVAIQLPPADRVREIFAHRMNLQIVKRELAHRRTRRITRLIAPLQILHSARHLFSHEDRIGGVTVQKPFCIAFIPRLHLLVQNCSNLLLYGRGATQSGNQQK